jgi:hypothetical protein
MADSLKNDQLLIAKREVSRPDLAGKHPQTRIDSETDQDLIDMT